VELVVGVHRSLEVGKELVPVLGAAHNHPMELVGPPMQVLGLPVVAAVVGPPIQVLGLPVVAAVVGPPIQVLGLPVVAAVVGTPMQVLGLPVVVAVEQQG